MYFTARTCLFSGDPRFLVGRLLPAPTAELFQFDLPLNQFLIFVGIVIPPLADGAPHGDKSVGPLYLCHGGNNSAYGRKTQQL